MSYIGTEPKDIRSFGRTQFDYTATQGQTAFTGADDDGKVLAFTTGQINVYVNGILMDDSDFTTTGTGTVTLASAANLNDIISIVSFESNIPDNDYVPASGGTFTGNVTNSGTVTNSGNVTVGGTLGVTGDVNIGNNDASNPVSKLRLGATLYGAADIVPVSTGHKIGLDFKTDSTGDTTIDPVTRMSISNEGYITTPFQPVFGANRANKSSMSSTNTLIDWSVIVNQGGHFDTSTNRFTCPVAGNYYCSFYSITDRSVTSSASFVTIRKNGSSVYAAYNETVSSINYLSYSASGLISCAANDILDFYNHQGTVYAASYTGGAIYLIG